ncbi:MAG: hypothetical protein HYX69_20820 [Planctomycetia bacterium]|nr:hypothetical protein [Planctomycetia bacterium]
MTVHQAIRRAEALLPGEPVHEGRDPRWQAILKIAEHIESEPEPVWQFIVAWGDHPQEDLRDAVACCLLEHLLEHHFSKFFPRIETPAMERPLFGDMFQRCWKFGQSEEPENAKRFDELQQRLGERG